nr:putative reverse transcriptase domain-containing protein [Tanacetum cinerariifolium]
MLATRGSGKVTTMEAQTNKTKGIRCLEHTLLGQSTRRHMLDLYLYAASANFTIIGRALAYTASHGEKKHYSGSKPLCSKCNYHHDGPCAPKCHKCNRFGHLARDCRSSINANTT